MDTTHFPHRQPPTTGLKIEVSGDTVSLAGPQGLMERILSLPLLNYVTMDGEIRTTIYDPIPHNGASAANGAIRGLPVVEAERVVDLPPEELQGGIS